MSNFVNGIYKNQALIYKVFLFLLTAALIVYLFPKGSQFKYELTKGKPWQYETLYAPFDFAIQKSDEEIKREKQKIKNNHTPYFDYDEEVAQRAKDKLDDEIEMVISDSLMNIAGVKLVKFSKQTLNAIYDRGVIKPKSHFDNSQIIYLKKHNQAKEIVYKNLLKMKDLDGYLDTQIHQARLDGYSSQLREIFFDLVKPNVSLNEELTRKDLQQKLD